MGGLEPMRFGLNPVLHALRTATELCDSLSPDASMVTALLVAPVYAQGEPPEASELTAKWGEDTATLVRGLLKVNSIYAHAATVQSENFRNLLLTFAEDIRVIILMIVDRLVMMRAVNHHPDEKSVKELAHEASYLYAPLAHRLGLYHIKGQLEDMALKYSNREIFSTIARQLNETKAKRDKYIEAFIEPIRRRLKAEGLDFEIKGRTKSISSIWNKMKKQHNSVEDIFDLFAIRVVLDVPPEREKSACWLVYSIITDMYLPNPDRLKDWISIPKSNGYESLHITVYGPDERWVEVQIRTKRMDEVAEKGLAAHWKYKGIKSESNLDTWMTNIRDILETAETGPMDLIKNVKMDVYSREVFVFTPKGDLYKLPQGASLLDFAFNIHTKVGAQCVGGRVNGKNRKLNYKLASGDTVEIFTSSQQEPNRDWLNIVVTSKARNKIRAMLKEAESKNADIGKELMQRRLKNRKIDFDEATMSRTLTRMGHKNSIEFFSALGKGDIDINSAIDAYMASAEAMSPSNDGQERVSASEFTLQTAPTGENQSDGSKDSGGEDVLVIGEGIKGMSYRMARCCNPIYGDEVFGFVSAEGVIKIHRADCPNAAHMRERYPYRVVPTRWSGKMGSQFAATLRVVGKDDLGIVTNISSIINKEKNVSLRTISIDSHDGLFQGMLVVGIENTESLNSLIKKIKTVKGVKDVQRSK
ncbi:MAG: RelA/SpoT family protein [Muribaculaceae bacterium]|nr:RelA/SpoT family protein [Muribaculaceae bacterium]